MELQSIKNKFGIIGTSSSLNRAIEMALRVAPTDLSVLITGESGVGKEFFPQIIHQNSIRKHNRYVAVNCGAIPEGTIDSELFGHEKGSFTGALDSRKGYFEEADGGTLFLDEVSELPLTTQVRLLRVLQSGEFIKVGSSKAQKTNVRVVAATNIKLHKAIEMGLFREDLYYRLNTVPIIVPSLRERVNDIALLFKKFSVDIATQYNMSSLSITLDARSLLEKYYWPGNIRQLKNVAEQITTIEQGQEITAEILKSYLPEYDSSTLPVLHHRNAGSRGSDNGGAEKDILYKLLFELRGEVSEMRGMIQQMAGAGGYGFTPNSHSSSDVDTPYVAATTMSSDKYIADDFSEAEDVTDTHIEAQKDKRPQTKQEAEEKLIMETLQKHSRRRKETAEELFMSERTLYRKLKKYGIE